MPGICPQKDWLIRSGGEGDEKEHAQVGIAVVVRCEAMLRSAIGVISGLKDAAM